MSPEYAQSLQHVSVILKLYQTIKVTASRAKKGHLFIGNAQSLEQAVLKDRNGANLRKLISDAAKRSVLLTDHTEDESPITQKMWQQSPRAVEEFAEDTSRQHNLCWMADQREGRVKIMKWPRQEKPAVNTLGGPGQAGQYGGYRMT